MEVINQTRIPKMVLYDGRQIPSIGIGTFGSDKYGADEVAKALYGAVKSGYRFIDCAAVYQNEDKIGTVLEQLIKDKIVDREELCVTSKVWNDMHGEGQVIQSLEQSLRDLRLDYIDIYFIHWPFPNYHAPGCSGDARNPDSRPFHVEEFMIAWRQCEKLVEEGKVKYIGMSNMTIPKLEAVLPLCKIKPAALEMELHPAFQQQELFDYAVSRKIVPIGYCPIGSPSRPERDRTTEDIAATEMEEIIKIAKDHDIHPALVCLKWAVQRGQIPIPFSVKEQQYISNLKCITEDPLTQVEMETISRADKNCRLVKGQVFLWPEAKGWEDLWDMGGKITC